MKNSKFVFRMSVFLVISIVVYVFVLRPRLNYKKAIELVKAGQYAEAFVLFYDLGTYQDSAEQAEKIRLSHNDDLFCLISAGNIVSFGTYEQDNNTSNGPEDIEWIVLKREGKRLLLVSRYVLDCTLEGSPYDGYYDMSRYHSWRENRFREWLNDTFLKSAFTSSEILSIPSVKINIEEIDAITQDKIFFLSVSEINQYFMFDADLKCKPTEYAKARGCSNEYIETENCMWWLRSHAGSTDSFITIDHNGAINDGGRWMSDNFTGIRPALWINLASLK